jgi:hypothetical protein
MTPQEFRDELNRLYAAATAKNLDSYDLAGVVDWTDRHTLVRWIGGYACPETTEERESVLRAIATLGLT